ncbi:MAG: hypothetical protein WD556_03700 [Actinomycetota bacterium]
MRTALRRSFGLLVVAALSLATAVPATAAPSDEVKRSRTAAGYLASQQKQNGSFPGFSPIGSTADAVTSLVAVKRGKGNITKALNFLALQTENGNTTGTGLQAKVALAAVAGGRNPENFGGEDLVGAIADRERPNGRLGAGTAVFDQALGILALEASGSGASASAKDWLVDAQCPDGGWEYSARWTAGNDEHCTSIADPGNDFFSSDTNTTSYAVMALEAAGAGAPDENPFAFFTEIRDPARGGWGYTWGFQTTDANSTGLVLQAYAAAATTTPAGSVKALKALQYKRCGAFAFTWNGAAKTPPDPGATISGIVGLLGRPYPIAEAAVTKAAPSTPDCPA